MKLEQQLETARSMLRATMAELINSGIPNMAAMSALAEVLAETCARELRNPTARHIWMGELMTHTTRLP